MRIKGLGRIQSTIRAVQNRFGAKAFILLYHRVTECGLDPQRLAVSPANFSQQMQVLSATTRPVPLDSLSARLKKTNRSERPLSVVTFDDGYADNLKYAAPILSRYNIPATVFVSTATINHTHGFYWDELEHLFLHSVRPARLELRIGDTTRSWRFEENPAPADRWDVRQEPRRASQQAYLQISKHLRSLPPVERENVLYQLAEWAGTGREPHPDHRVMTHHEIRQLTEGGLISVGAHTVNHPILSSLSTEEQSFEIVASRTLLEKILNRPVSTFSYPYGRIEDYSRQTIKLLKKAGFTCACANFPAVVNRWTDPLQLPRFGVGNWPGESFERYIRDFIKT